MTTRRFLLYQGIAPFALDAGRDREVTVDFYLPRADIRNGVAVITLAGGAYTFLSKKSGEEYGRWFAKRGFTVIVPSFRLGSEGYDFRAMCTDVLSTVAFARRVAGELGFHPDRLGLMGTSAGAHMAGVLSTGAGKEMLEASGVGKFAELEARPDFCVLCYGVLSLLDPLGHVETCENFLGALRDDPAARHAFSPVEHVSSTTPQTFLCTRPRMPKSHPRIRSGMRSAWRHAIARMNFTFTRRGRTR